jgi:hypothetical protein
MSMDTTILANHYTPLLQTLPVSPTSWFPFAAIAIFTVILVAAIVYMISGIINSDNARAWSRFQIYEALLSMLLLVVFVAITGLFFLNPQPVFGALKIVPQTNGSIQGCTSATQLYTLATCDVSEFNNASFSMARDAFLAGYAVQFVSGLPFTFAIAPITITPTINFTVTVPSLLPSGTTDLLDLLDDAMLFSLIFNQLQLFLLSAAIFFLGFFVSLGLIARTFGFARTFGGAMIAFGLGLGIIYPLLVALTYGYIDVAAGVTCIQSISCSFGPTASTIFQLIFSASTFSGTGAGTALGNLFKEIGFLISGLTIVPLINVAIVDAFIIDFSNAVGEKLSFRQLFTGLI